MTVSEIAFSLFAALNGLRVLAYLPQILRIARDDTGAAAISYLTWGLFGASNLSTAIYAAVSVKDWPMTLIFSANAVCCTIIVVQTTLKRREARRSSLRILHSQSV